MALRKQKLSVGRLMELLVPLPDHRRISYGNIRHGLIDVLVLCLLGIICGCQTIQDIIDFGKEKLAWLQGYHILPRGLPSDSTIERILDALEPGQLEEVYRQWVGPYIGSCIGKQVCVDGKTICAASTATDKVHMISAWVREDGISLGQLKVKLKDNEITAIPQLLAVLDIRGSIVTIDAMGCRKKIAEMIISKEAHYVLQVKLNNPTLMENIEEYFLWAEHDPVEKASLSEYRCFDPGHGRLPRWRVVVSNDVRWFAEMRTPQKNLKKAVDEEEDDSIDGWKGLRSLIMVERTCVRNGHRSVQRAFFISSLVQDARAFCQFIRGHWSIENSLHWVLDVQFGEDDCLIRRGNAPENLNILRKMALSILQRNKTKRDSFSRLQKRAGWNNDFLLSLIS